MLRRWREGCHASAQLWHSLQALGYTHSGRTVSRFLTQLRRAAEAGRPPEQHQSPVTRPQGPSPRAVSLVIVGPAAKRTTEEQTYLDQLWCLDTLLARTNQLTQRFLTILRERHGHELDAWIASLVVSGIDDLARFARGLQDDQAAVKAGLTLEGSSCLSRHSRRCSAPEKLS
jgi:hypothetical protein